MIKIPFAIPFLPVAVSEVLIPALGAVAVTILGWYLSRPHGRITWTGIVSWVETNIKQPVEYVFKGIKERFWDIAHTFHNLYWAIRFRIECINNFITQSWLDAKNFARSYVKAFVDEVIEVRKEVTRRIWQSIHDLQDAIANIKTTVIDYVITYLEGLITKIAEDFFEFKGKVATSINKLWEELSGVKTGLISLGLSLVEGITSDVLPNIDKLRKDLVKNISKAIGLSAIYSAFAFWVSSLFNSVSKPLQPDLDFLERLDLDWLLVAYLNYTKPVLIDRAPEVLNTLLEGFNCIKKATFR